MVFYRNLLKAALEIAPDQAMRAIADVVTDFRMPGHGIPGFERAAAQIAIGGVYNLRIHHDDVLQPVLRHLKVMEVGGLGPVGLRAQDELGVFLGGWTRRRPSSTSGRPPCWPAGPPARPPSSSRTRTAGRAGPWTRPFLLGGFSVVCPGRFGT